MPRLGVRDGGPLTVDPRSAPITSWDGLWDALAGPCGLPIGSGGIWMPGTTPLAHWWISAVLDAHPYLIVRVLGEGLFAPGDADGLPFVEVTAGTGEGRVEIEK